MNTEQISYCIARQRNDYDSIEIRCYEDYLHNALKKDNQAIYDLPYPKHRFLSYLTDAKNYLAHGTPLTNLTLLKAIRKSKDTEETGHEKLLLAASDAIWAMWYAVLDKSRMGSLTSNDCIIEKTEDGKVYSLYYFSVDYQVVDQQPYQSGSVYIVEPDTFLYKIGEERGSQESVKPLFKVDLSQDDFPYLPYVKGVDAEAIKQALKNSPSERPWLADRVVFPVSPEIPAELRLIETNE